MFSKIFVLFLCSFYLSLSCKSGEIAVDGVPPEKPRCSALAACAAPATPPRTPPRGKGNGKRVRGLLTPHGESVTPPGKVLRAGASPSPKTSLSPFCRSERGGCFDPRVVRASANYAFGGGVGIDLCDPWLDRNLAKIKEICQRYKQYFTSRNCALLGLQLVCEVDQEVSGKVVRQIQYSKIHDLNVLFVSGGKKVDEELKGGVKPHLRSSRSTIGGLRFKSIYDFLPHGRAPLISRMRASLRKFYDPKHETKLSPQVFAARCKELCSPKPQKSRGKAVSSFNPTLGMSYLHSEQGILLMLTHHPQVLAPLLSEMPAGATIHRLVILIASKNEMCRYCGCTFSQASKGAGPTKVNLRRYMTKFRKKGFKFSKKGLSLSTIVGGLKPFDRVRRDHWLRLLEHVETPVTDIGAFGHHVLQRFRPCQRKPKSASASVARPLFGGDDDGDKLV